MGAAVWMIVQGVLLLGSIPLAAVFLRSWRQSRTHRAYVLIVVAGFIWAAGQYAEDCILLFHPDETAYYGALLVTYFGMWVLGPACVYLAWSYTGRYRLYRRAPLLFGVNALLYLSVATNGMHHLYYVDFSMESRTYGPLFYVFTALSYGCFIYGYVTMQRRRWPDGDNSRTVSLSLLACFGSPVLANTWNMLHSNPLLDLIPLSYLAMLAATIALLRYQWPTILRPFAARQLLDDMDYPVYITGRGLNYRNKKALALPDPAQIINRKRVAYDGRVYWPVRQNMGGGETLLTLADITDESRALAELEARKRELTALQAILAEQAQTLAQYAATAAGLAGERRRLEIMRALDREVAGIFSQLRENTERMLETPCREGLEDCIRLTVAGIETVRRIINEYKRRNAP